MSNLENNMTPTGVEKGVTVATDDDVDSFDGCSDGLIGGQSSVSKSDDLVDALAQQVIDLFLYRLNFVVKLHHPYTSYTMESYKTISDGV